MERLWIELLKRIRVHLIEGITESCALEAHQHPESGKGLTEKILDLHLVP
jgi:hypothetical protein